MREQGLHARAKRKFKTTTLSNHREPKAPNLLDRKFNEKRLRATWLSDITYLRLKNGKFVYLCAIIDLASREVVGWHVDENMETTLVTTALKNAAASRPRIKRGAIFHSDFSHPLEELESVGLITP